MSFFHDPANRTPKQLVPGVTVRTFWGDRMLMSLADLEPGAVVPPHSHPHEQTSMILRGEVEVTIGEETRLCRVGDIYIVPGDVVHGVVTGADGAQAIEAFAPVREEYKFPN